MDERRSRLIQTIRNSADSKVDLLSIVGIDGDRRQGYALREWNITGDIREIRMDVAEASNLCHAMSAAIARPAIAALREQYAEPEQYPTDRRDWERREALNREASELPMSPVSITAGRKTRKHERSSRGKRAA